MTRYRKVPRPLRGGADRAGQGRLAPARGGMRAVQQAVLRALAAGQPPGTRQAPSSCTPGGIAVARPRGRTAT
jgi:hypothetical protein